MAKTYSRRYLIEIKNAKGAVLFSAAAYWGDKERRIGIAQIERLARLPEVNFYTEPALAPQSGYSDRRPSRGTGRLDPEPG
jgi:hypothetical protein